MKDRGLFYRVEKKEMSYYKRADNRYRNPQQKEKSAGQTKAKETEAEDFKAAVEPYRGSSW